MYNVLACKEGMIAVESDSADSLLERAQAGNGRVTEADGYLLPRCRSDDTVLAQPPLAISLEWLELLELIGDGSGWPVTATCFGPPQDKSRNEDAALSAVISGVGTQKFIFAAVADGVSTRTFWSERASRLACLAAFKELRSMVVDGSLDLAAAAPALRTRLARSIRQWLVDDRAVIMRSGATPPDWAPDLYAKHIHREEFWYNSTLLMCCLGPTSGVAFWAGDGGLKIVKKGRDGSDVIAANTYVKSTDDSEIHTYVSLSRDIAFSGGPIDYSNASAIDIFLASDGVDRTLQRDIPVEYESLPLESGAAARECLQGLWLRAGAETDNYSLARISWPVGEKIPLEKRTSRPEASATKLSERDTSSTIPTLAVVEEVAPKAPPTKKSASGPTRPSNPPQATLLPDKIGSREATYSADKASKITIKVTLGGVKSLPVILNLLNLTVGRIDGEDLPLPLSDPITKSAYRLWMVQRFFTINLIDERVAKRLGEAIFGKFLGVDQMNASMVVDVCKKLTHEDAYMQKFKAELDGNSLFTMLTTAEMRKLSSRDLMRLLFPSA